VRIDILSVLCAVQFRQESKSQGAFMQTVKYVYWQDQDKWLGYLAEFPDYWTQGESEEDLIEHLKDLFKDLRGGEIESSRRVGEMIVP
jgi:predicted RNase H-like HicB family nuclease